MKKVISAFVFIFSVFILASCRDDYELNEEMTTVKHNINDVSEIEIRDIHLKYNNSYFGANVYILGGEEQYVSITASVDLVNKITVKKVEDELVIYANKLDNYVTKSVDIYIYGYIFEEINLSNVVVDIKKESINSTKVDIDLSGATNATIEKIDCSDLNLTLSGASNAKVAVTLTNTDCDIKLSGASKLEINEVTSKDLDLELSGASTTKVSGSIDDVKINASGASRIQMLDAVASKASAKISGASSLEIAFTTSLDGSLSGGSELKYYTENGISNVESSSGSRIEKVSK